MAEADEGVDVLPALPGGLLAAAHLLGPLAQPGQMGDQRQARGGRGRPPQLLEGGGHRGPVEEPGRAPHPVGDARAAAAPLPAAPTGRWCGRGRRVPTRALPGWWAAWRARATAAASSRSEG